MDPPANVEPVRIIRPIQDEDVGTLRLAAREFAAGFNSGDVDRIMRWYGDTYVDINLREPIQSWQTRRQYYLDVMKTGLRVDVQPDEIIIEGDLAFIRGTIHVSGPDQPRKELRYVEIARRTDTGSWKMFWGMDGPVQEYTPPHSCGS